LAALTAALTDLAFWLLTASVVALLLSGAGWQADNKAANSDIVSTGEKALRKDWVAIGGSAEKKTASA